MRRALVVPFFLFLGCASALAASPEKELQDAAAQQALAEAAWRRGDLAQAEALAKAALAVCERLAPDGLEVAASLNLLGNVARRRGDLEAAAALGTRALKIRQRLAPDSSDEAASWQLLGRLAQARGDADEAERCFLRQKEIAAQRAPGGLEEASSIYHLASVKKLRGDLEGAAAGLRSALEIQERLAPGGQEVAQSLNQLGVVLTELGDLAAAEALIRRSLAIYEKLAPESLDVGIVLNGLSTVAAKRGNLELAEGSLRRAIAIQERLAPGGLEVAAYLNNLGAVLYQRGDLEAAEAHYRGALAIYEKLSPDSLDVAMELANLSNVAEDRGALDAAETYAQRAVRIAEQRAPDSLDLAENLNTAGHAALARGDLDRARAYFERDLQLSQKLAPDTLTVAVSLSDLSMVLVRRGDLAAAEAALERGAAIQERLAPESSERAWTQHELGSIRLKTGRCEEAREAFRRAVAILEAQIGRLGGSVESQADFRAQNHNFYWDLEALLVRQGRPEEAFQVLERSRARGLLALLAERDLVFSSDLPEEIRRDRWRIAAGYDRVRQELAEVDPGENTGRIEALNAELRRLHAEAAEVEARIRREAPKLAALQYPQPLDFRAAQQALEPGTVMLSYSVGTERTHLFIVTPGAPIAAMEIPGGEADWQREVAKLRALIEASRPAGGLGAARRQTLESLSRRLYERLLGPAEAAIGHGERLLILPDGPLHALPWAALVRKSKSRQYLIEWRPFQIAASATVYAELRTLRREPGRAQLSLVAFGDPAGPSSRGPSSRDRTSGAAARSSADPRLPAGRAEVERIAHLFAPDTKVYLGRQATEEQARTIGRGARYVHFATHGRLDERCPLSSGLALASSTGGPDDGILQAWEIFEGLRLDADLVVLSTCESGLGKELPGEGLLGLTRAFQYAGARAVAASLWRVADRSTQDLMVRFYRHLKNGEPAGPALRAAQTEMIRSGSPPFDWAAFEIFGDGGV
jgi:CHAT domain-containing protein/Tfp pilus assembly protein PilF